MILILFIGFLTGCLIAYAATNWMNSQQNVFSPETLIFVEQ